MSNSAALALGSARAREIIARHILNSILVPLADDALDYATRLRIKEGHNMTGNTVNAYAVGVYVKGKLAYVATSAGRVPKPLRAKLTKGSKPKRTTAYFAGEMRWEGEEQLRTFMAEVQTNNATEADRSVKFLREYQANPGGWALVVCNGVEYADYQENLMQIDTLTGSFEDFRYSHLLHFKPIPD